MKNKVFFFVSLLFVTGCQVSTSNRKMTSKQVEANINGIIGKMTLDQKIDMIGGFKDFNIRAYPDLGLPEVRMSDGPGGVRNYEPSTAYPAAINTAASWDTAVASAVGAGIGEEAASKDVQIMLGPAMNIYRAPMCGRNFEYLGEDPYLAGQMAASFITGMQNQGVMATAKHYDANNQEYDRHKVSSDMDQRTLHEIYLPAFRASVEQGHAACVMTSYNLVNGVHASQNDYLINQVLKKDWGFDGIVMSDWASVYDGVAAAKAGLDLEMPSAVHMCRDTLMPAIKDGKLAESVIDDKVRRIIRMYYRFGLMDSTSRKAPDFNRDSTAETALNAARGGIVLLKNENSILPLDKKGIKTVAVMGPNADPAVTGGGGSSFVRPYSSVSVLQGIRDLAGNNVKVTYSRGPFEETYSPEFFNQNWFGANGLKGEFFSNANLSGKPAFVRKDSLVNFRFDRNGLPSGIPEESFSARWTGNFKPATSGNYTVVLSGDDGIRLYVNGKLVIDRWHYDRGFETATIPMQAGKSYPVRLEYYQSGGNAFIRMGISMSKGDPLKQALETAKNSDVAVVCVGFNQRTEGEGQDRPYALPSAQEDFIKKVSEVNKNTIVVVNAGGNVAINDWIGEVKGLLYAWYPGEMGGQAVAEILFGEVNPSGKLPISIEKRWEDAPAYKSYYDENHDGHVEYSEGIFAGYRHYDKENIDPLFPFGFGLSYTSFEYSNIKVDHETFKADDGVTVSFDVKNTGKVKGKEVAELYVSDPVSSLPRPVKELKAFTKVELLPGQTKTVSIKLDKAAFSYYNPSKPGWIAEPGEFDLLVGSSSRDIRLTQKIIMN